MSGWVKGSLMVGVVVAAAAVVAAVAGAGPSVGECGNRATAKVFATYRVKAADGNCLQGYAWEPAAVPVRGVAVLLHGIHDHPGRYDGLARALNERGIAVIAQDHRGHGASGGARQRIDSVAQLAGDVELALAEAARRHPGVPRMLYGHSMGGLVAAHLAVRDTAPPGLAGVVLSSAALALPASAGAAARMVVDTLSTLAPELPLEAVDPAQIVREPAAREALRNDPSIERSKVPARTIAAILGGVTSLQPLLPTLKAPLLVLHGSADRITDPAGSRTAVHLAGSSEKKLVIYDAALHSLLHEPEGAEVRREIVAFFDAHATAAARH